jgi:putative ABC transport system permease protein
MASSIADSAAARLALGWLVAGEAKAHPARFALTALAIAVGVALGFAVHLINRSALVSFDRAVRSVGGAADLSVRASTPLGFDEALYPRIALSARVADASPVLSLEARIGGQGATLLGLDAIRAARVTPALVGVPAQGSDPAAGLGTDGLFLSRALVAATGLRPGARVTVTANGRAAPFVVAGTLPGAGEEQRLAVADIAAVQWRFGRLGRIDRIDIATDDADAASDAVRGKLPPDARLSNAELQAGQSEAISRAYRVNLEMLALVALLTGGFLVFSAQSLAVVRRQRVFALLRTLGLPRGGVVAAVGAEGLVIGLAGGLAGLGLGYLLARTAIGVLGGDLGAGYFRDAVPQLSVTPGAALVFLLLGIAAALGGSLVPARMAARAAPAAALKNAGDPVDPRTPVAWRPALVLLGLGGAAAFAPAIAGLPLLGFAAMALLLAGGVAGVPWLARTLLAPALGRPIASVPVQLALRHLAGAPGEAATALCGIVASTALMIAMATMVTSFRHAVDDWLGQVLSADLYLRRADGFDPAAQRRLAAVPGVADIAFSRQIPLTLAPDRAPVTLIARPMPGGPAAAPLVLTETAPAGGARLPPAWVSEPAARIYGWRAGDTIRLPVAGGQPFAVRGVWRDYARQAGAVVIAEPDYRRLTGDLLRDEAGVALAPGAAADSVAERLRAAAGPGTDLAAPATLRRFALQLFDRSFAVTYALEAVAVLVGLAGVAATMSGQTFARRREFGMLRHLGVGRGQILALLATEGALLGAVGGVAGAALGLVLSQVLIHVINPQSFNFTMGTVVPWGTIAALMGALVAAAAGTAVLAARRAVAGEAVLAVREDW